MAPGWEEPFLCFLVGGLLGVLLYRLWITALASLLGTLLIGYSGFCLAERLARFNSVAFVEKNGPLHLINLLAGRLSLRVAGRYFGWHTLLLLLGTPSCSDL